MALTESQIKTTIEEYLNLEASLKDFLLAKEEAIYTYEQLLEKHKPNDKAYSIHEATPVISAYDDVHELELKEFATRHQLNELGEKIKRYITALKGESLYVRFSFDDLNHREGDHIFYIDHGELRTRHAPLS